MNQLTCIALAVTLLGLVNLTLAEPGDMLKQSEFLLKKTHDLIIKLEGEGHQYAVESVKKVESFLLDVDGQIHRFHPHTLIGRTIQRVLEGLLAKGEHMLEDIIKKLDIHGDKGEEDNKEEDDKKEGN